MPETFKTETNPFTCFVPGHAEKLILGSFPCFNGKNYGDWYYSGSGKNHFWKLLADVYNLPAGNQEQKIALCTEHKIALTDVAYKIQRRKGNCSDANLTIVEYNFGGMDTCLAAPLNSIFFTSRFVETHFRLHYSHVVIPSYLLPSPSPAANIHIGGLPEYKELRMHKVIANPYDYRLLKYRSLLLG